MADFKSALEALAKGELKLESLNKQLDALLKKSPQFANKMLLQLDEVYERRAIDDKQYAALKRQINQFRRTHASKTEGGESTGGADSTVFSQDSVIEEEASDKPAAKAASESTAVMNGDEKPDTA
ncbi:MAG: hypothetical protein MI865_08515, partial [Proteobacteria bacterium]|nr:hypothetical protein [Pseudomonadota bacterium]